MNASSRCNLPHTSTTCWRTKMNNFPAHWAVFLLPLVGVIDRVSRRFIAPSVEVCLFWVVEWIPAFVSRFNLAWYAYYRTQYKEDSVWRSYQHMPDTEIWSMAHSIEILRCRLKSSCYCDRLKCHSMNEGIRLVWQMISRLPPEG